MRMTDLIARKRAGGQLSDQEIAFFVEGYCKDQIPDYQAAALCMAICFQGMSRKETAQLTLCMAQSGEMLDLSGVQGVTVDKHSTGGVGDSTTLIVAPLVAACGLKVAKMSGRGLGHTGGTVDKLEAIPGFRTDFSKAAFINLVNENGLAVVGQSAALAPADKKLYALRDVTATVDSIPLIASSIMSKKLAAGAQVIVLDVKCGSGAFMKTAEEAFMLAREMVSIGEHCGRQVTAVITDMHQPLGRAIGNALDIREAIEALQGMHKDSRLLQVSMLLGEHLLLDAGQAPDRKQAREMLAHALRSGAALTCLRRMIAGQGGDALVCDDRTRLPIAQTQMDVKAERSGYIVEMDAQKIGRAAQSLGAGRERLGDNIDHGVGIVMHKQLGDAVTAGESMATLYVNQEEIYEAKRLLSEAIQIGEKPSIYPLVYGVVTQRGEEHYDKNGVL